ncbi:EamA family transporter [Nonomuraea sp. NPDC050643]|uniref:EamA family transporter n=1 Tax=Nonomuraea sp. NPDC050643 TaxID=3155660 RepID=UPI0033E1E5FC
MCIGAAAVSAICFGSAGIVAKALGAAGFAPLQLVWIRLACGTITLTLCALVLRPRNIRIPLTNLPLIVPYGIIGIAAAQGMYFAAVTKIPVPVALLIVFMAPLFILLWALVIRREPPARSAVAGSVVTVFGLAVALQVWNGMVFDLVGVLFACGASIGIAVYFLLAERLRAEDVDPLTLLIGGLASGTLILTPVAAPWNFQWEKLLGAKVTMGEWQIYALPTLGWLTLVCTTCAYLLSLAALKGLSSTLASTLATLEVPAALILSWLALGEALSPPQWIGTAIMVGGSYLAQRRAIARRGTIQEQAPLRVAVQMKS